MGERAQAAVEMYLRVLPKQYLAEKGKVKVVVDDAVARSVAADTVILGGHLKDYKQTTLAAGEEVSRECPQHKALVFLAQMWAVKLVVDAFPELRFVLAGDMNTNLQITASGDGLAFLEKDAKKGGAGSAEVAALEAVRFESRRVWCSRRDVWTTKKERALTPQIKKVFKPVEDAIDYVIFIEQAASSDSPPALYFPSSVYRVTEDAAEGVFEEMKSAAEAQGLSLSAKSPTDHCMVAADLSALGLGRIGTLNLMTGDFNPLEFVWQQFAAQIHEERHQAAYWQILSSKCFAPDILPHLQDRIRTNWRTAPTGGPRNGPRKKVGEDAAEFDARDWQQLQQHSDVIDFYSNPRFGPFNNAHTSPRETLHVDLVSEAGFGAVIVRDMAGQVVFSSVEACPATIEPTEAQTKWLTCLHKELGTLSKDGLSEAEFAAFLRYRAIPLSNAFFCLLTNMDWDPATQTMVPRLEDGGEERHEMFEAWYHSGNAGIRKLDLIEQAFAPPASLRHLVLQEVNPSDLDAIRARFSPEAGFCVVFNAAQLISKHETLGLIISKLI